MAAKDNCHRLIGIVVLVYIIKMEQHFRLLLIILTFIAMIFLFMNHIEYPIVSRSIIQHQWFVPDYQPDKQSPLWD